jgi:flagellar protein FlgJ
MTTRIADANNFLEINGLSELKRKAKSGDQAQEKQALEQVAKQFESIFMQMMLKSMRQANDVLEADSPFNSQSTKFYRDMHDQQLALELSSSGNLGLAEMIVRQLGGEEGYTPSSVLRNDGGVDSQRLVSRTINVSESDSESDESIIRRSPAQQVKQPVDFQSPLDFINKIMPYTELAQEKLGVAKEVFVAQAALETGWGQKIIRKSDGSSSHNLFNIKADKRWQGDYATKDTLEYEQGAMVRKKEPFRVYQSLGESVTDYINFLSNSERYQGLLNKDLKVDQFLQGLQSSGYATDPNYASKVMGVLGKVVNLIK